MAVSIAKPAAAPDWANDIARLWNEAERCERINGRPGRELVVALPAELDPGQRAALAKAIATMLVERYQVAVLTAIHVPDRRGDQRNHHAHLMFTTRVLGPEGFGAKVRQLNDRATGPEEIRAIRAGVESLTNAHLVRAGVTERVDARRLAAQAREAERRGDLMAAAVLTREPTRHVGQSATAARRRGERSERSAWNVAVKESNAQMLASFVAAAKAEGRLVDTPTRSGAEQAKIDRVREAITETNETRSHSSRPIAAKGRSRQVSLRQKIAATGGRGTRAQGKDADMLNAQAAASSDTQRVERDVTQRYMDALQAVIDEHGQRVADAVAYARLLEWPIVDVRVLAQHRLRDPRCGPLLRQGIAADAQWRRAQKLAVRRRDRHGATMVATAQERRRLDQMDQDNQPPVWKPRSRRAWAELRRQHRASLGQAQRRERRAQALVSDQAMAHYAAKARTARDAVDQIERKRRVRFPVPGDVMRASVATSATRSGQVSRPSIRPTVVHPPVSPPYSPPHAVSPRPRTRPGA